MNPIDFLTDLLNPELAFLPKALAVAVISSIVCGIVGAHVVLRGMAFIGDAVSHAVFPGLAIAFVIEGNLVLGGTMAGVATAVLVAVFSQNRRLKEDSLIGIFFVAAFALGVVVISQAPGYAGSLEQFLFGSITGIPTSDLYVAGIAGVVVLAVMFLLHKEFVTVSLDRESARAMGLPVFWLDLVLYVLVTIAVVISVQTIGNILVLALLVTPAATARLLTDRLAVMMTLSPLIGGLAAVVGLYLSWSWDLPTGGTIVLVLTAAFLVAWFVAPRQGLVATVRRRLAVTRLRRHGGRADSVPATHRGAAPGPSARRWVPPALAALLGVLGAGALVAAVIGPSGVEAGDDATSRPTRTAPTATAPAPTGVTAAQPTIATTTPISALADPAWLANTAQTSRVPERALAAYAGASLAEALKNPGCHLGWNTLAAIGQVESAHGTLGGATIGVDGVATPTIIGRALDGHGVATIPDTDHGRLDGDTTWDHAVGPLQFTPATWATQAQDGNHDGLTDINNIDDAALAAAGYLCRSGDLTVARNWIAAVTAYNPDPAYTNKVADAANSYAPAG